MLNIPMGTCAAAGGAIAADFGIGINQPHSLLGFRVGATVSGDGANIRSPNPLCQEAAPFFLKIMEKQTVWNEKYQYYYYLSGDVRCGALRTGYV